ncbi:MAG: metabolite traffic protein EboE [Planctomycetota bacterium]
MRISRGDHHWSLTYCGNVHPVGQADELLAALEGCVPELRDALDPERRRGPFALGLWFSAAVARELVASPRTRRRLADRIAALGAEALTANAFPYGDFHADAVKHAVYRPDWTMRERLDFTLDVAHLMAELPLEGPIQTISTLPGKWGPASATERETMVQALGAAARGFAEIEARWGRRIVLGIEPEPGCCFETTEQILEFFTGSLFVGPEASLRHRHLGVCFDVCHQAVEHEDVAGSLRRLVEAGIPIAKIQLSTALEIAEPSRDAEALAALASFDEPRYLHQVVARDRRGGLRAFDDLHEYLAVARERDDALARCHFHVPIFRERHGPIGTTQAALGAALDEVVRSGLEAHLEVETYSWGVQPERREGPLRREDLCSDLGRELRWVLERVEGADVTRG